MSYEAMTGIELVRFAAGNAGAAGAGALAELTRRQIEAANRQIEATDKLRVQLATSGGRLERLTWALLAFTVALLVIGIATLLAS